MEPNLRDSEIVNDVLHNDDHSKLTQEEIAKALAHHKKRHQAEEQQTALGKTQQKPKQQ